MARRHTLDASSSVRAGLPPTVRAGFQQPFVPDPTNPSRRIANNRSRRAQRPQAAESKRRRRVHHPSTPACGLRSGRTECVAACAQGERSVVLPVLRACPHVIGGERSVVRPAFGANYRSCRIANNRARRMPSTIRAGSHQPFAQSAAAAGRGVEAPARDAVRAYSAHDSEPVRDQPVSAQVRRAIAAATGDGRAAWACRRSALDGGRCGRQVRDRARAVAPHARARDTGRQRVATRSPRHAGTARRGAGPARRTHRHRRVGRRRDAVACRRRRACVAVDVSRGRPAPGAHGRRLHAPPQGEVRRALWSRRGRGQFRRRIPAAADLAGRARCTQCEARAAGADVALSPEPRRRRQRPACRGRLAVHPHRRHRIRSRQAVHALRVHDGRLRARRARPRRRTPAHADHLSTHTRRRHLRPEPDPARRGYPANRRCGRGAS